MKDDRENIRKEVEERSPFLSKMKEAGPPEGFDVPPNYFRELPTRVLEKLSEQERSAASQAPWRQLLAATLPWALQPRYAAGLATAAVLIIAGLLFLNRTDNSPASADMFNALTADEVSTYIQSNLHKFEEEMVIEAAEAYQELSLLPPPTLEDENLEEEYYEELLRELDEESLEELL